MKIPLPAFPPGLSDKYEKYQKSPWDFVTTATMVYHINQELLKSILVSSCINKGVFFKIYHGLVSECLLVI